MHVDGVYCCVSLSDVLIVSMGLCIIACTAVGFVPLDDGSCRTTGSSQWRRSEPAVRKGVGIGRWHRTSTGSVCGNGQLRFGFSLL